MWRRMFSTYQRLHYLKKIAKQGCTSPTLKKAIDRLTKDITLIRPMYNYVAQIAINPRRVFVYGAEFRVRSKKPLYLSRTFAIGDALYRISYDMFKKYVDTHTIKGQKRRLRLNVVDNSKVTFAGLQAGQTIINNRASRMIRWDTSVPLHELGHYIDQEAGLTLGFPRLSGTHRLKQEYERRMRLAFPRKADRETALRLAKIHYNKFKKMTPKDKVLWKKVSKHIRRYFFDEYSITNELEFFAVAFRHYFDAMNYDDRLEVAKYAPQHYKVFEMMRQGFELRYAYFLPPREEALKKSVAQVKRFWLSAAYNHAIAKGYQRGYEGTARMGMYNAALKIYHLGGLLFAKLAIGGFANVVEGDEQNTIEHGGFASIGYGIQLGKWHGRVFGGASLDASMGIYFPTRATHLNAELMAKVIFKVDKEVNLFGGATFGVNARLGEKDRSLVQPYAGFALGVGF